MVESKSMQYDTQSCNSIFIVECHVSTMVVGEADFVPDSIQIATHFMVMLCGIDSLCRRQLCIGQYILHVLPFIRVCTTYCHVMLSLKL